MGKFRDVMSVVTLGIVKDTDEKEEKRRLETPFSFEGQPLSEDEFHQCVFDVLKTIKGKIINVEFGLNTIMFIVEKNNGSGEWSFVLDINDFGKMTGKVFVNEGDEKHWDFILLVCSRLEKTLTERINNKANHICPNCNANLSKQKGFDETLCEWECRSCGFVIKNK